MQLSREVACLMLLYRRFEHVEEIVSRCVDAGISHFYFAIDGPRDEVDLGIQSAAISFLEELCKTSGVSCKFSVLSENRGIFINMVTALEWFFSDNYFGIILEDDTIPNVECFDFFHINRIILENNPKVLMLSGWRGESLNEKENDEIELCSFPLIWGWATTSEKWKLMSSWFFDESPVKVDALRRLTVSYHFWEAGYRRAISGKLDSWSIVLTRNFLQNSFKSLVPAKSLIENVGIDTFATNSKKRNSRFYRRVSAKNYSNLEKWLIRDQYYVSYHHFLSPIYAPIIDFILRRPRRVPPMEFLRMTAKNQILRRDLRSFL